MIEYNPSGSCDINIVTGINDIVKTCSGKITTMTSSFKDICINKPPLPTDVCDDVNIPISCINPMDIDDIERSSSYSLSDIAKCSTIPCQNIYTWEMKICTLERWKFKWCIRVKRHSCQLVPPFMLNKHIYPFGNLKYHCYLNFVIQLFFSIPRIISHYFQFNSSTEGSLSKCLFETAHCASSSTDVDALKFRLEQYVTFYGDQIQQDSSWGTPNYPAEFGRSIRYCGFNNNNSIGRTYWQGLSTLLWF